MHWYYSILSLRRLTNSKWTPSSEVSSKALPETHASQAWCIQLRDIGKCSASHGWLHSGHSNRFNGFDSRKGNKEINNSTKVKRMSRTRRVVNLPPVFKDFFSWSIIDSHTVHMDNEWYLISKGVVLFIKRFHPCSVQLTINTNKWKPHYYLLTAYW